MKRAAAKIESFKRYLKRCNGFVPDPKLSTNHNFLTVLKQMPQSEYNSMLTNMKFHNLCTELKATPKIGRLLGLNLSFCLESPLPDQDIAKTMKRLRRDVCLSKNMATPKCGQPPSQGIQPSTLHPIRMGTWS